MAVRWVLFATHDGNGVRAESTFEALKSSGEKRRARDAAIEDVTLIVVVLLAFRPPAEFPAEKAVLQALCAECWS
jgi:hypothetical protein